MPGWFQTPALPRPCRPACDPHSRESTLPRHLPSEVSCAVPITCAHLACWAPPVPWSGQPRPPASRRPSGCCSTRPGRCEKLDPCHPTRRARLMFPHTDPPRTSVSNVICF